MRELDPARGRTPALLNTASVELIPIESAPRSPESENLPTSHMLPLETGGGGHSISIDTLSGSSLQSVKEAPDPPPGDATAKRQGVSAVRFSVGNDAPL